MIATFLIAYLVGAFLGAVLGAGFAKAKQGKAFHIATVPPSLDGSSGPYS